MKSYLQRIGRSLMLPVAVLPAAAILMGIGYWIDPQGWGGESPIAAFLIRAGSSLIDNMAILFAIGVALGMSRDRNGSAAISGLVGYLVVTTLLNPETVAMLQGIELEQVNAAFGSIENQFIGILVGLIAAALYNRFSETRLPQALSFFSGRRLPPIMTAITMLFVSLLLMFLWPPLYGGLVAFGTAISGLGALGAGIYGFFNRLLIPVGLHHALNAVFWFDVAGINDIQNFWAGTGELGVTGMYQAGFFPVMMFGLPAGALAMYHMADESKKKETASLMIAAAFASFFTGVTEPLEFAFMFVAPQLYLIHALFTGVSLFIAATFGWTAGFGFSAGFVDYFLSFNLPLANQPYMLLVQGAVFAVIYYFGFRWAIKTFDLATPGRGKGESEALAGNEGELAMAGATAGGGTTTATAPRTGSDRSGFAQKAEIILAGLGGPDNVDMIDPCATRLRVEVKDMDKVNEQRIKSAGIPGTNKTGPKNIQVVVGTEVEFVANEIEKLRK
ncbi:N-acetylglucosamine-specific PTS transporter subunit IIBC [Atopococcus tabaci]|uniref:N-acetylglucosamine-specific PTS transporter subunit IIBC n=1 Tax=Atopococcus tabaci TaxID=269774 RepID=UPI002409BB7B|nr:N-acetylglucosamine-specific PTS transporter subunit IIBC [Atopococcus tabaci]